MKCLGHPLLLVRIPLVAKYLAAQVIQIVLATAQLPQPLIVLPYPCKLVKTQSALALRFHACLILRLTLFCGRRFTRFMFFATHLLPLLRLPSGERSTSMRLLMFFADWLMGCCFFCACGFNIKFASRFLAVSRMVATDLPLL